MQTNDSYVPALRFRWLTPLYDLVVGATTREHTVKGALLRQAEPSAKRDLLDLGCGTGTLAIRIKQENPSLNVVGLDGDPQILAIADRKASQSGQQIEFKRGLSYDLPFGDGAFDCVLSSLFFHHLAPEQKKRTLEEVKRVLRPGGQLHVADWGKAKGPISRALFYSIQLLDGFPNTRDHVSGKFPAYLDDSGFRDVEVRGSFATIYGTLSLFSCVRELEQGAA